MGRNLTTGRPEEQLRDARGNVIPILGFDFDNPITPIILVNNNTQRFGPLGSGIYMLQAISLTGNLCPYVHFKPGTSGTTAGNFDPVIGVAQPSNLNHPPWRYMRILTESPFSQTHIVVEAHADAAWTTINIQVSCTKVI